jgi:hypothetical protein
VDVADLDRLIRDLRALDRGQIPANPKGLAELQASLIEGFRRFEFGLRRELGAAGEDRLTLSGSDEAPAQYRKLIEEYYRALARERKK